MVVKRTLIVLFAFFVAIGLTFFSSNGTLEHDTSEEVKGEDFFNTDPIQSSYIISTYPSSNYSASNYVRAGYNSSTGSNTWAYLKFDLSEVPAGATLVRASLQFYPHLCEGEPGSGEMYVNKVTSSWSQNTITWNNKPSSTSQTSGTVMSCDREQHIFYVTDIVNSWLSGYPNNGFVVYGPKSGTWYRTTYEDHVFLKVTYSTPDAPTTTTSTTIPGSTPVTTPPQNPSPGTVDQGSGTSPGSTKAQPSASKPAAEATAPVDETIKTPLLTKVKKNGKELKMPMAEKVSIEINQNDSLELIGTSFPDAKIVVFIEKIAFESKADASGNWSVVLDSKKIKTGEYQVQAQAQKDGKGSQKISFFKLKRVESTSQIGPKTIQKQSPNFLFVAIVLGVFLLILTLIGLLLERKFHWFKKTLGSKFKKKKSTR